MQLGPAYALTPHLSALISNWTSFYMNPPYSVEIAESLHRMYCDSYDCVPFDTAETWRDVLLMGQHLDNEINFNDV